MENSTEASDSNDGHLSTLDIFLAVGYIVIFVCSAVGNSLVMAVIWKNRRKKMRSVSSNFIFSMAAADLVMTVGNLPERVVRALSRDQWLVAGLLGIIICKVVNFVEKVSIIVSISNLTSIATDRFFNVFFPHKRIITIKRCHIIIVLIWTLASLYCSPIIYYANVITKESKLQCKTRTLFPAYADWFLLFLSVLIISLVTVIVLYTAICIRLLTRKVPGNRTNAENSPTARVNSKVLRMVTVIVIVFYVCFTPYWLSWIFCAYPYSPKLCTPQYTTLAVLFSYINIALNPIIYVSFSGSFREGVKSLFRKGGKVRPASNNAHTILAGIGMKNFAVPNNQMEASGAVESGLRDTGESEHNIMEQRRKYIDPELTPD
ncbi:predicted protein [Nematostella vectensis]|uniref:G-protein coupled receptors family 1 profile domain-containing protein n=1 Tax=Nematostella vectensis TaxID=45351 RepID=A7RF67_NEMVE|nr:neuropeptide FF receptor 1 [Nematostella vectensis]EDO49904.1 predicted protein [Nematostella vectensis]|eukprot:XP_001641967.1 predicted protein [Nematostella vectensis]